MAGVRLEFAQFGHFDYFNIYRNPISTAIDSLGQPIGTSSTMYYEDFNAEPNLDYFYRVGVVNGQTEIISDELRVVATNKDIYFNLVDLLLIADQENGTSLVHDYSSNNRSVTTVGIRQARPRFNESCCYFSQGDSFSATINTLGTSDFTIESWVAPNDDLSADWCRLFQIGVEGAGYISLFRNASTSPMTYTLHARNASNTSLSLITTAPLHSKSYSYNHICVMRKAGVFYLFIDGVLAGSTANYASYSITHTGLYIMNQPSLSRKAPMLLDSFRLTKVARYDVTGFVPIEFKKS